MGPFPWKAIRINELEIFNKITQYNYLCRPAAGCGVFVAKVDYRRQG
jgi:hypothetical protein